MWVSNVNPTIVSCSSQNCNWWRARVVQNFNGVQHATGWLDVDIDQDTAGIDGLGLHGIVGMEEVKCCGDWTWIKIWLILFGLCSRRCGSQQFVLVCGCCYVGLGRDGIRDFVLVQDEMELGILCFFLKE